MSPQNICALGLALALGLVADSSYGAWAEDAVPAWAIDALSTSIRTNADSAGVAPTLPTLSSFADKIGQHLLSDKSGGLLPHAEFEGGLGEQEHPWLQARSLLPLRRTGADSIVVQGDVARPPGSAPELGNGGVGLGVRHLLADDRWMVGANAFVDEGWPLHQARGSLGGEIGAAPIGLSANLYEPVDVGSTGPLHEPAAAGYDVRLRVQVPYIRAATASLIHSAWGLGASEGNSATDRLALNFRPLSFVSLDGSVDHSMFGPTTYTAMMHVSFSLMDMARDRSATLFDDGPFHFGSMVGHLLDMIRRDETVPMISGD